MKNKMFLLVVVFWLGLVGTADLGIGAPFHEKPPIIGAYTLRGGEWQLGGVMWWGLSAPPGYVASSLTVAFGLSPWFQVGLGVTYGIESSPAVPYMAYSGHAKVRLPLGAGLDLGIPLAFSFVDRGTGMEFGFVQGGIAASIRVGTALTIHAGGEFGRNRYGTYMTAHGMVDLDIWPNLKVVGELEVSRPRISLPSVTLSVWTRPLDFLDVQLALAPLGLSVATGVYLRF